MLFAKIPLHGGFFYDVVLPGACEKRLLFPPAGRRDISKLCIEAMATWPARGDEIMRISAMLKLTITDEMMNMAAIDTQASQTISAEDSYATISYVPQNARVTIGLSGISDSTVTLEAQWNQKGSFAVQKSWTSDPTEAEYFDAPRACALRLGVAAGAYGSDTISADLGFDYPIGAQQS